MDEIAERYAEVETCECGDPIEQVDGGGYSYWLHVKRMSVEYGHAAVPVRKSDAAPDGDDFVFHEDGSLCGVGCVHGDFGSCPFCGRDRSTHIRGTYYGCDANQPS